MLTVVIVVGAAVGVVWVLGVVARVAETDSVVSVIEGIGVVGLLELPGSCVKVALRLEKSLASTSRSWST